MNISPLSYLLAAGLMMGSGLSLADPGDGDRPVIEVGLVGGGWPAGFSFNGPALLSVENDAVATGLALILSPVLAPLDWNQDAFLRDHNGGLRLGFAIHPRLAIEATALHTFGGEEHRNRQLVNDIRTHYAASPILSYVLQRGVATVAFRAFDKQATVLGRFQTDLGLDLRLGGGLTRTVDNSLTPYELDPDDIQAEPLSEEEQAYLYQWHPTAAMGVGVALRINNHLALRFDKWVLIYTEELYDTYSEGGVREEKKYNSFGHLGLVATF